MGEHPVADALHPAVTLELLAELAHGEPVQPVGLAIAARVDVVQHLPGQPRDGHLGYLRRLGEMVQQVDRRAVGHPQRAGVRPHAQVAVVGEGVGLDQGRHRLAQYQRFVDDALSVGVGRVDVEDEIAGWFEDLVVEVERQLEPDHGCTAASQQLATGPQEGRRSCMAGSGKGPP